MTACALFIADPDMFLLSLDLYPSQLNFSSRSLYHQMCFYSCHFAERNPDVVLAKGIATNFVRYTQCTIF